MIDSFTRPLAADELGPLPTARENPFDPPADLIALAERGPLHRMRYPDGHLGWLVTGHELGQAVLTDPRFSARADRKRAPVLRPGADSFYGQPPAPGWFVDMDRPEHTRYRRLLGGAFTVRRVRELRPRIEEIVAGRLQEMARRGPPVDLVAAFALPVPSLTICELLGVPYEDRDEFQRNSAATFSLSVTADEGAAAMRALTDYLLDLVRRRLGNAGSDDLLGALAESGELTDIEIAGAGVLLLTAGHETVASMLGLGAFALLRHPAQLARLRDDPSLIESAVEELLRYLTIFQFGVPRAPVVDLELGGHRLAAGDSVTVFLPLANRDPRRFTDPHALDLGRSARGHMAFGFGAHQCIGQNLARVELEIGIAALLRAFPALRLAVDPGAVPLGTDMGFYCVHELPVTW